MAPQKRVKDELEKGSQFASERSSAEREVNVHRSNIEKFTHRGAIMRFRGPSRDAK